MRQRARTAAWLASGSPEDTINQLGAFPEAYDFRSDDEMSSRYDRWFEYRDRVTFGGLCPG